MKYKIHIYAQVYAEVAKARFFIAYACADKIWQHLATHLSKQCAIFTCKFCHICAAPNIFPKQTQTATGNAPLLEFLVAVISKIHILLYWSCKFSITALTWLRKFQVQCDTAHCQHIFPRFLEFFPIFFMTNCSLPSRCSC